MRDISCCPTNTPVPIYPFFNRSNLSNCQWTIGEHMIINEERIVIAQPAIFDTGPTSRNPRIGLINSPFIRFTPTLQERLCRGIIFFRRTNQRIPGPIKFSSPDWLPKILTLSIFLKKLNFRDFIQGVSRTRSDGCNLLDGNALVEAVHLRIEGLLIW